MDGVTVYEENVPGFQIVGLSLNVIGSLSGKEDDHFVKIMIMVGKIPFGLVLDVKKPEILLQIAGFFSRLIEIVHIMQLLFLRVFRIQKCSGYFYTETLFYGNDFSNRLWA